MSLDTAADQLAREIEHTIQEGEQYLEEAPTFPPRPGKYEQEQNGGAIPVKEIMDRVNNDG